MASIAAVSILAVLLFTGSVAKCIYMGGGGKEDPYWRGVLAPYVHPSTEPLVVFCIALTLSAYIAALVCVCLPQDHNGTWVAALVLLIIVGLAMIGECVAGCCMKRKQ